MWRYKLSIFSGIILIGSLSAATCYLGKLDPTIYAVGGLLFSIPIRLFWQSYMSPVLKIKGVEQVNFNPGDKGWTYKANRIIVENSGRSAAKNCKGYIVVEWGKERVCWTVPKERPNATINPRDNERLDFCAFHLDGPFEVREQITSISQSLPSKEVSIAVPAIIAPTEEDWGYPWKCRSLNGIDGCKVLITADNTEPVEAKIIFEYREKKIVLIDE